MERSYPVVFLAVFALVTAGALIAAGSVSGSAFSTYNPSWEGTSELRSLARETDTEIHVVRDAADYPTTDPGDTVVFVLSPETAYARDEAATVREFVEAGGTVVIADDFGAATDRLLGDLGVGIRLDGAPVRDEEHFDSGPALPVATNVTRHSYTRGVDQLTLNHATVLRVDGANASRLVGTSTFAYLDANRNEQLDDDETLDRYTVVAVERVGDGRVVVGSDPSVFINAMLDREGNRQFATNVLAAHDRAGVDVSHAGGLPPVVWLVVSIRESPLAQLLGGGAVVLGVAGHRRIAAAVRTALRRVAGDGPDPPAVGGEELLASLQERYPDRDEQRLRRVAQNIITRQENSRTDE